MSTRGKRPRDDSVWEDGLRARAPHVGFLCGAMEAAGTLSGERAAEARAAGVRFVDSPAGLDERERLWRVNYALLRVALETGRGKDTLPGALRAWLRRQITAHAEGTLESSREGLLAETGLLTGTSDEAWRCQLERYKERPTDKSCARWMGKQRRLVLSGDIDPERARALETAALASQKRETCQRGVRAIQLDSYMMRRFALFRSVHGPDALPPEGSTEREWFNEIEGLVQSGRIDVRRHRVLAASGIVKKACH